MAFLNVCQISFQGRRQTRLSERGIRWRFADYVVTIDTRLFVVKTLRNDTSNKNTEANLNRRAFVWLSNKIKVFYRLGAWCLLGWGPSEKILIIWHSQINFSLLFLVSSAFQCLLTCFQNLLAQNEFFGGLPHPPRTHTLFSRP